LYRSSALSFLFQVDESSSKRLKWDCESYATQYSNIYNRPTLIQRKDCLPVHMRDVLLLNCLTIFLDPKSGKLSRRALKRLDRETKKEDEMEVDGEEMHSDDDETMSHCTEASTYRPKGETPEQRRLRKQAVKEARRSRRQEKKGNKQAFAEEHRKIAKQQVGQVKTIPIV
ncbi:hypothetical protein TELCIR_17091, partial [Teladorsagia circumcincta]